MKIAYSLFTISSIILLFTNSSAGKVIGSAYLIAFIILQGIEYILSDQGTTFNSI